MIHISVLNVHTSLLNIRGLNESPPNKSPKCDLIAKNFFTENPNESQKISYMFREMEIWYYWHKLTKFT